MNSSPIDEIKAKLDIKEVIGSYIKLTKAGANYKAVCPFHGEKTPSLFVSPARQIWHCFGCGEGHSIFDFVMKIEGIEFADALRLLARKAGVELRAVRPELRTKRNRLHEICELAAKFFEKQLQESAKGKTAKQYLLKRGISGDSIKKWKLGWSPEPWSSLTDFLNSSGYGKEEIEKAGLAIRSSKGTYFDRFRSRIMFPVFDLNSQVIGFGGRILEKSKDQAKYMNTPNTLLYDKGKVLYGLDKSKIEIRKKDACMLVEGYVDVVLAHQSGLNNVVAVSGTALTPFHLDTLKRYSNNLVLAFDMDFAGNAATQRGIDMAQSRGFDIQIVKMPLGKDPADILSENPQNLKELIRKSVSILEFHFQDAFAKFDEKTARGKKQISELLLPVIKKISNRIEQASWVQQLASRLNVKEMHVEEELKKVRIDAPAPEKPVEKPAAKSKKELLEERIMTLVVKAPQHVGAITKETFSYLSPKTQAVISNFQNIEKLSPELTDFVKTLSLKAELDKMEEEEVLPELEFCLKEIRSIELKARLDEVSFKIKEAEKNKDSGEIKRLSEQFNQLTKKITSV